jgi:hypothetical protein
MRPMYHAIVLLILTAVPAAAQDDRPPSPLFRGLFGGAAQTSNREHALDLRGSLFAAYIDSLESRSPDDQDVPDAWLRGGSGSLVYSRNWERASVGGYLSGGSSYVADYRDSGLDPWVNRWNAGAFGNLRRQLGRRTQFSLDGGLRYSPYYGFDQSFGLGGVGAGWSFAPDRLENVPGLDYQLERQPSLASNAAATLTHQLSARGSLEGIYETYAVTFLEDGELPDQLWHLVRGRYVHRLNRFVSARVGYGFRRADYGEGGPQNSHEIDVGIDGGYGKDFRLSRRTTFSFDTRSSVFVYDRISGSDETFDPRTRFFVGGNARLAHRWGRTWQADARYDRTAGYVDGFSDPFFSDILSGSVRGVPVRRLDTIVTVSSARGSIGFAETGNDYTLTSGTAQLRLAVNRYIASFAQYFYYRHEFGSDVRLPIRFNAGLERQGVAVGLSMWLPLL